MIARYRALTPTPKGAPQPFKKRVEMMIARYRALTPFDWKPSVGNIPVEMMIARYRALTPHDQGSWRTAVTAMLR